LKEEVCLECRAAQNQYDNNRFDADQRRERYLKYPANPDTRRARWRRYDAAKRGSRTEIYSESQVVELYGTCCYLCNEEIDFNANRRSGMGDNWEKSFHIDHVVAISKGGSDTLDNVRPAHNLCNLKKGGR
jgi:5-methylcytosine-specific restriction endonuclease McrA